MRGAGARCAGISFLALVSCGGNGNKDATDFPFSPASIAIDKNKLMMELTSDERATMCTELSRALTATFGTKEVACRFGSHSGTRENQPTCTQWYDDCLGRNETAYMIGACTTNMEGMWRCPITAAAYVACFNDSNRRLLDYVADAPVCAPASQIDYQPLPSCVVAPCDYAWFD